MNTVVNCEEPFYGSVQFLDKLYRIPFGNPATYAITFLQHFTLLVIIYSCNIMMYSNSNLRVFYTRTKTNTETNENCKVHLGSKGASNLFNAQINHFHFNEKKRKF